MNLSTEAKTLIGIGLATIMILVAGIIFLSDSSTSNTNPQIVDSKVLVKDDSYKIEVPNSKVTVVEFLDPECEACRASYPTVKQILKEYDGRITFVVRYLPLHQNSMLAAKSAEAAGEQGKYWEMLDKLFENQPDWGEQQEPQTALFTQYAEELGLDMAKFKLGLENKAYEAKVNRDKSDAISAGARGTPTFFINGKLVSGVPSYNEFKSIIDAELNQ